MRQFKACRSNNWAEKLLLPSEFKYYLGSVVMWACQAPNPQISVILFVCTCVYMVCTCVWVHICVHACMHVSVCMHRHMHACTCVYECMHMLINNMHVVRAWTRRSEVDVRCLPLLFSTQYLETVFLWICKCWSSDGKVFWQSGVKKYHKVTVSLQFATEKGFLNANSAPAGEGAGFPGEVVTALLRSREVILLGLARWKFPHQKCYNSVPLQLQRKFKNVLHTFLIPLGSLRQKYHTTQQASLKIYWDGKVQEGGCL